MKGSKISVGMGCICFGMMLTVSMAEITQSYFSWFSRKKLVSLISPETSDSPESYHITTLMGITGEVVGQTADVAASSLNAHGMNGARNVTFTAEKRSVKRGGVDYFGDPITETPVTTDMHLGRISIRKNYSRGMNKLGNPERLSRYKRNADKQTKEANGAKKGRKAIEAEAEYRRMESAARRKEARDEKVKNIKSRRVQLKNTRASSRKSPNTDNKLGGKENKPRNNRLIKQKTSIRKNGSKKLSNGPSSKNHHKSSAQKRKLKNKPKKKERTCVKSTCKTEVVGNRQKGSKAHNGGQKMSLTKEWRKSHPGHGAQGNYSGEDDEHVSEETHKHGAIKKKQHRDDQEESDQQKGQAVKGKSDENETTKNKTSAKKGSVTTNNKIESSKKVSNEEVLEESDEETRNEDEVVEKEKKNTKSSKGAEKSRTKEMDEEKGSEDSISSKNTASKTKGGKISAKKGKTGTKKRAQEESKDSTKTSAIKTGKKSDSKKNDNEKSQKASNLIQKQGNDVVYLSPVLGLGLSSRKRTLSKAQAWSRNTLKRPMTGGYASSGKLTRASSNLYGAYASAGAWQ